MCVCVYSLNCCNFYVGLNFQNKNFFYKKKKRFSCGLVVKIASNSGDTGSVPCRETKILYAARQIQKNNKNEKDLCRRLIDNR